MLRYPAYDLYYRNNMRKLSCCFLFLVPFATFSCQQNAPANIELKCETLMHEMRVTPSPANHATVADRSISFQWPLRTNPALRSGLDGAEESGERNGTDLWKPRYKLRYSKRADFKDHTTEVETPWPFFNPEKDLASGVWYWQYGYIIDGKTEWKDTLQFTVRQNPDKFCPPSFAEVIGKLPATHPRVWLDKREWDDFIRRNATSPDRATYILLAEKALKTPMESVENINVDLAEELDSEMKRNAMLTRESRRVIDKEEANTNALIFAYLLTKDRRYAAEAVGRVKKIITWGNHKNVTGDFNDATFVAVSSLAYDALYDLLDNDSKREILACIRQYGTRMYDHYNNYLENHIADNHVWQMNFRILTLAAFVVYGDLPEAGIWANYCYNVWLARFPGLNKDGGWHNGDSYFHTNIRTLVEVPFLFSRLTGFNYFSDPWYTNNIAYVIYQQPPFSKSAGNGSSHQRITQPSGPRVSYADAVARMTNNTYAADYVRRIQAKEKNILNRHSTSKGGGLAWFRLLCKETSPQGPGLSDMPMGHVFPETGLASFSSALDDTEHSAMISFRSSPYGSTSHALANQNAFNTFWGGKAVFYSSGHHIAFTDEHSMYCHRATRAHNTVLIDGMGQRIGTEGYGWIPRYYVGEEIGYVLGDASRAYGSVVSPLWLKRAEESGLKFTPENGWDETGMKTFRRHIIVLGKTGFAFVYDELEATRPVTWSYLLHTIACPMEIDRTNRNYTLIRGRNGQGVSDAYLFSSGELRCDTTRRFFVPAVNWLRADDKGNFESYSDHWHFSAASEKRKTYRFATVIHTYADSCKTVEPRLLENGSIEVGGWNIRVNLSPESEPSFFIRAKEKKTSVTYRGEAVVICEKGKKTVLKDKIPELEI